MLVLLTLLKCLLTASLESQSRVSDSSHSESTLPPLSSEWKTVDTSSTVAMSDCTAQLAASCASGSGSSGFVPRFWCTSKLWYAVASRHETEFALVGHRDLLVLELEEDGVDVSVAADVRLEHLLHFLGDIDILRAQGQRRVPLGAQPAAVLLGERRTAAPVDASEHPHRDAPPCSPAASEALLSFFEPREPPRPRPLQRAVLRRCACMTTTYVMMLNGKGDYACFVFADKHMHLRCLDAYARLGWLD